jgi:hypothetical protein
MKVTMKTRMAGPSGNASPGATVEVAAALGAALVAGGFATAVEPAPTPKTPRKRKPAKVPRKDITDGS